VPDVLIVGGGPVGLFMAALLLQNGVRVRVLEQRTHPETHSRAIGIHPPSLAALHGVDVAGRLVGEGVRIRRGIAIGGGIRLAQMSFASVSDSFPYVLSLPQTRTEAVLEQRVRALDADALHRGVRLTQLHDDGGRVTLEASFRGGTVRYSARLVIAADGVRSTVRALTGTALTVKDYPDSYLMGDFADGTGFGPDAALFLEGEGIVESFPLPGKLRRWVLRLGAELPAADAGWLTRKIRERTGIDVDPGTNSMLSSFGVRFRLARRMVSGRTVLIGDAAHEVSPIGGQGMNLGWLDAVALAPLVLAELQGGSVPAQLRSFERARLRAAARAARQSEINMALGRPLGGCLLAVRNGAISAAAAVPAVNSLVARRFTMQ
jgi:2-polyprenyl-6-methoxyphenol hydroxylase-like FAD-dependent oxidoreductase